MDKPVGYADLNIPNGAKCQEVATEAVKCGYKILAINTPVQARYVTGQGMPKKGGKKRKWEERSGGILSSTAAASSGTSAGVPKPPSYDWLTALQKAKPWLRILQRLTIIFGDISELQAVLTQANIKEYDLIAVIPTNHDAMQACITSTSAPVIFDIISFDFEGPHWIDKLRLNRTKGDLAADKGIMFEITYASSLHGNESVEHMIYTANCLKEDICVKRIKNIIISSGAAAKTEVRAPKDVSLLGYLLGMSATETRRCIMEYAHRLVSKSVARSFGKTWVAYIPVEPEPDIPVVDLLEDEGDSSKEEPISPDMPVIDLEDEVKKEEPVSPDVPDSEIPIIDLEGSVEIKKDEPVSPGPDPETAPSSPLPEPEMGMDITPVPEPAPTVATATDKPKKKKKKKKNKRSKK